MLPSPLPAGEGEGLFPGCHWAPRRHCVGAGSAATFTLTLSQREREESLTLENGMTVLRSLLFVPGNRSDMLAKAAPTGPPSFDGKVSGTVAFFAFHDAYHTGQVSYLRKWLGHGQTVG